MTSSRGSREASEFFDLQSFAVRQMAAVRKRPNGWDVTNEGGVPLAELEVRPLSPVLAFLRLIGFDAYYPVDVEIRTVKGGVFMRVQTSFTLGVFQASLKGSSGEDLGQIKQNALKSFEKGNYNYSISDASGKAAGSFRGNWRSNVLQIFDEKDNMVGKISRNDKMVSRVTFTGAAFHTVEVYVPFRDERARRLVMSAAAVIDRLIGKPRK